MSTETVETQQEQIPHPTEGKQEAKVDVKAVVEEVKKEHQGRPPQGQQNGHQQPRPNRPEAAPFNGIRVNPTTKPGDEAAIRILHAENKAKELAFQAQKLSFAQSILQVWVMDNQFALRLMNAAGL